MADTTEIIFGDDAPEGFNYAIASPRGRRVHLTAGWFDTAALCGTGVVRGPEHLSGRLCKQCEEKAEALRVS